VGNIAEVSELHSTSIFRVNMYRDLQNHDGKWGLCPPVIVSKKEYILKKGKADPVTGREGP
jgi:hypothetical protein